MSLKGKILSVGVTSMLVALSLASAPAVVSAAPQLTIQQEKKAHPRIEKAIHAMEDALKELREAPDDFGGNKAAAIGDTEKAMHSLKKALYYRLKMDDAAIDRVQ
jgi:hypothetical protein